MVSPILPVVAEDLGATGAWLGLSFSAFAISQASTTLLIGRLSDRWGRKLFIIAGFAIYGLAAVGYALAGSFHEIIVWRFIGGFGTAAVFPIAMAYIGDMSPPGREGTFVGTFNSALWLGFGAGPLLGGVVRDVAGSEMAFWSMAAILFTMVVTVAALLPPRPPRPDDLQAPQRPKQSLRAEAPTGLQVPLRVALRDNTVRGILVFNVANAVGFGAAFSFLAVYMEGELGAGPALVGVVLASRTWVNGGLAPFTGRVADRHDRVRLGAIGLVLTALGTMAIADMSDGWALVPLFAFIGVGESVSWSAVSALIVERGRVYGMGNLMGLRETAAAGGLLFGSLAGGAVGDVLELGMAFRLAGVIMLFGVVWFFLLMRRVRQPEQLEPVPVP